MPTVTEAEFDRAPAAALRRRLARTAGVAAGHARLHRRCGHHRRCYGNVTFLNTVAQSLTGWKSAEAAGVPLEEVFKIVNEKGHRPIENPAARALREGVVVGLANHSLLFARDGTERPIEDSAAPIRNEAGDIAGVVLVFRDITERRRHERAVKEALDYDEEIVATLREPFLVLEKGLRVRTANAAFYRAFRVSGERDGGPFPP